MKKKLSLAILSLLALTACSNVNRNAKNNANNTAAAAPRAAQVSSQGLGQREAFADTDLANANCLSAPEHQTYHFKFDNSQLSNTDQPCAEAQAYYLKQDSHRHVWLFGNTDERGSREYNIGLGERRAKSVANFLEINGVKTSQVTVISYGQEKPVDSDHNEQAYRLNRRVELYYKGPSYVS